MCQVIINYTRNLKNGKMFVVHFIFRQDSEIKDPHPAEIERRYTHFRTLYLGLKRLFPDMLNSISFPKKVIIERFIVVIGYFILFLIIKQNKHY